MTEFDKKLIEKARRISRWHYLDLNALISIADTEEARLCLRDICDDKYDSVQETL